MFLEILQTLIKVLMVFSILIIAFGLSFFILMSKVDLELANKYFKAIDGIICIAVEQSAVHKPGFVFDHSHVADAYVLNDVGRNGFRWNLCATVLLGSIELSGAGVYFAV